MINNNSPLVTVLVASYNHQNFVTECIKSIVNQTYKNIELIVIDDGSSDGSISLIDELAKKHRFDFIHQKNEGLPAVLNKGLALAKGEFFVAIASDDMCFPDRIEKQVNDMRSHEDAGVCVGNCLIINEHGVPNKSQSVVKSRVLDFEDVFLRKRVRINAPTAMCRTDLLREVGGYDPAIKIEDIYMWLKVTNNGSKIYVSSDVLAYYRKHDNNQSKDLNFMADGLEAIYAEYDWHPKYKETLSKLQINLFAKSVKRNSKFSLSLFKRISPSQYTFKLLFMLFTWLVKAPFIR